MNDVRLRAATRDDMPAALELVKELAAYENAPQEVTVTADDYVTDGFDSNLFKCIVAELQGEVVGMCLYYPRYSTWKGRTIHLEDFIVKQKYRQHGIGKKLFDAVVKAAQDFGAKRLEWAVLEWNKPALNFYDKINAEYDKEWFLAQLREQQIKDYTFGDQPSDL